MVLERVDSEPSNSKIGSKKESIDNDVEIRVVKELPVQEVREVKEDGKTIRFVTIEEALTIIANAGFE